MEPLPGEAVSSTTSDAPSVLAATDFSSHARHAVDRAARVAHQNAARLTLMHVIPGHPLEQVRAWLGSGTALEAELKEEAQKQLDELAHRLQAARQVAIDPLVAEGAVVDAMLAAAERSDARLIVLGARGAGFMRRFVVGTTSERVMRRSTRPILVVRQTPHERYRRVLVAVDFSPGSLAALRTACWVAPHAHIVLTTVFQVPFENRLRLAGVDDAAIQRYREQARTEAQRRLRTLAAEAGLPSGRWEVCVAEGDPLFRLLELEPEYDCDLVAVGKHGNPVAVDWLLGSVTRGLLAECASDVLISTQAKD